MGLLFTHKNSDFGAITVTEPSWAAHIPKVERPNEIDSVNPFVSYFDAVWSPIRTVAEVKEQGLETNETEVNLYS